MDCKVVDFSKDSIVYNITGCSKEELDNKLNLFFGQERFKRKADTPTEKVYQRGNKVLRVLFGVFVKYFRITVSVKSEGQLYSVRVVRDMNLALSGGLMGIAASRKEFNRLMEAFKIYFAQ
jgi:hypothetical protein